MGLAGQLCHNIRKSIGILLPTCITEQLFQVVVKFHYRIIASPYYRITILYLRIMASRMLTLFGEEIIPEEMQVTPGPPKTSPAKTGKEVLATAAILAGWKPDKQYYTIGEVAALFNVRTSHIRFWTTEFDLKVRTTGKGARLYTPAAIAMLRTIYHLVKERGFTIPGAKAKLREESKSSVSTLNLRQALLQLRNQLLTIRNELL